MSLTPEQTTFRRIQTDNPGVLTVYLSVDATDATGATIDGPWRPVDIALTEAEAAAALAVVARARQSLCDRINGANATTTTSTGDRP